MGPQKGWGIAVHDRRPLERPPQQRCACWTAKARQIGPRAISPSPSSWRGSDAIRVLLFLLTLRSGRAILRYYPRLLSSWPTSSTDAPRLAQGRRVTIGEILRAFTPTQCANYFRNSGYAQS